MLVAARNALEGKKTKLIAVTLLTSLNQDDLNEMGIYDTPEVIVRRLTLLAQHCGLSGVVCSAMEAAQLRGTLGDNFWLVTPGIRLADDNMNDQVRVATPCEAMRNGADYLVVGRPITQSPDPLKALQRLNEEVTLAKVDRRRIINL
jgi:orotidine-5'-phosphate decarboxylase